MDFKSGLAGLILSGLSLLPTEAQKIKYLDKLVVNNDSTTRVISYRTEEQGIEDMKEFVKTSKIEEAWFYDPKLNLWYEVGKFSYEMKKENGDYTLATILDKNYLDYLIETHDEGIIYHFHPEFVTEEAKTNFSDFNLKIQSSIPSEMDLFFTLRYLTKFYHLHPKGNLKSSVVYGGIIDMEFTEKGKGAYKVWTNQGASVIARGKSGWRKDLSGNGDYKNKIKEIVESMSDENLSVKLRE